MSITQCEHDEVMHPASSLSTTFPKPLKSGLKEDFCDSVLPSVQGIPHNTVVCNSLNQSSSSPKLAPTQVYSLRYAHHIGVSTGKHPLAAHGTLGGQQDSKVEMPLRCQPVLLQLD